MAGISTIDSHPAYVLFDSGASYSFMSMDFGHRHNIPLMAIPFAYRISTPGVQMCVNTRTDTMSIVLATHTYHLQFMILPRQGIDAILGSRELWSYDFLLLRIGCLF